MPDDQLQREGTSVELVTEQATIGARLDADPGGPGGERASGWWAVTDAGVRLFVSEDALSSPQPSAPPTQSLATTTAGAQASNRFRTLRSGQRVELRWRRDAACTVEAVLLPPLDPSPPSA